MKKRLVAILRDVQDSDAILIVETLINSGITELEVSLSSEEIGLKTLKAISDHFGNKVRLGVGTIVNMEQLKAALNAGAHFVITPAFDEEIVRYCIDHNIEIIPGVFTPSDVMRALNFGITTLKLFPANALPLTYIKSMSGPFPKAKYIAVGGVTIDTVTDYFDNGFIGVAPGNDLVNRGATKADLLMIESKAKAYVEKCERYGS